MGYIIEIRPDWAVEQHCVPQGADLARVLQSILVCGDGDKIITLPAMSEKLVIAAVESKEGILPKNEIATELISCGSDYVIKGTAVLMRKGGVGMCYEESLKWYDTITEAIS